MPRSARSLCRQRIGQWHAPRADPLPEPLGWAGIYATKGRNLARAAFVIGVLGVVFNVVSYAEVFI